MPRAEGEPSESECVEARAPEEGKNSRIEGGVHCFASQREREVSGYRTFLRVWVLLIPFKTSCTVVV